MAFLKNNREVENRIEKKIKKKYNLNKRFGNFKKPPNSAHLLIFIQYSNVGCPTCKKMTNLGPNPSKIRPLHMVAVL